MFTTVKTPSGIVAPLKLNDFEFQRRYRQWRENEEAPRRAKALKSDTDTRRALYYLRNYGVDGVMKMDAEARELKRIRQQAATERIVEMMTMEAVASVRKELNLARRE